MLQEAKEENKGVDQKLLKHFNQKGHLFVGYCLTKRFITMFNEEGKPKMRVFKETESYMAEHSAMIGSVLGKRSVNIE